MSDSSPITNVGRKRLLWATLAAFIVAVVSGISDKLLGGGHYYSLTVISIGLTASIFVLAWLLGWSDIS